MTLTTLPPPAGPAPLPVPNPTKSFWLHSDPSANPLAQVGSSGPLPNSADIVIVGSGVTGCSVAYHLARLSKERQNEKPLSVVILEARDFCSGATGRNGGHITATSFLEFSQRAATYGVDEALRSAQLEQHTVSSILEFLDATPGASEEVDLVRKGQVFLPFTDAELEAARKDMEAAKEAGLDLTGVEWLTPEKTKQRFRVGRPAVYIPGNTVWSLKLVTKLFQAAKQSTITDSKFSLDLFTHAPVDEVQASNDGNHRWLVKTGRGDIKTRCVVHATNAYASHLLPQLAGIEKGIVPNRGHCMAVRGSIEAHKYPAAGWGANKGYEYWLARPIEDCDDRVLAILGGGRETAMEDEFNVADDSKVNPNIYLHLRGFLPQLFPNDFEKRVPQMAWSGIMGFTRSGDPMVGRVYADDNTALDGQYISAGYSGHGMPRAFGCAEVLSQMIYADLDSKSWSLPDWFPRHMLTKCTDEQ